MIIGSIAQQGVSAAVAPTTPFATTAVKYVGSKIETFNRGNPIYDFSLLAGGIGQAMVGDLWIAVGTEVASSAGVPGFGVSGTAVSSGNLRSQAINDSRDNATRIDYGFVQDPETDQIEYFTSFTRTRLVSIHFFRAVNSTTPLDVAHIGFGSGNTVRPNAPSITPITDEALIINIGTASAPVGARDFAAPTDGSTLISVSNYENGFDGRAFHGVMGKQWRTGDGAFDPDQFLYDDGMADRTDGASIGVILALRP